MIKAKKENFEDHRYRYQDLLAAGGVIGGAMAALGADSLVSVKDAVRHCASIPIVAGSPTSPSFLTQPVFIPDKGYVDALHRIHPVYYREMSLLETVKTLWPVETRSVSPVVMVNVPKILASNQTEVQADLVRTCAVFAQWPNKGYERRFRQVYGEALRVQATWLDYMGIGKIPADPRGGRTSENKIILDLIGSRHSSADTGFEDFQWGIDMWLESANSNEHQLKKGPRFRHFPLAGQICEEFIQDIARKYGRSEVTNICLSLVSMKHDAGSFSVLRYARVPAVMNRVNELPELKQLLQQRGKEAEAMGVLLVLDSILKYINNLEESRSLAGRTAESIMWHLWDLESAPGSENAQPLTSYQLRGQLYYD